MLLLLVLVGGMLFAAGARAALQFDVFLGIDGVVPEGAWFPVVCEVKNDGPPFMGVIEVTAGSFNQGQTRRMVVELPTGTLKRLCIPVFSSARFQSQWDVRLLDERGKVRGEQIGVRAKQQLASKTVLLGALPRTVSGTPVIRQISSREADLQPATARWMQAALFPDNPLVLEGMDAFYLNAEKAVELGAPQVEALLAWLNNGGHLIVAVEQISDVNSVPWLKKVVPVTLSDQKTVEAHPELQQWLKGAEGPANQKAARLIKQTMSQPLVKPFAELSDDSSFEAAALQVATGKLRSGGEVLVSAGDTPLMVESAEGRGRVTTLLFSPEREPARSWKHLPSFWAKVTDVPPALYATGNNNNNNINRAGLSIDGVFGAMIDSKQVRKLPVEWLLLLLIVYLVVIGPLDQYWLKRIKRPMLTWVTFPCYVVMFSLLIYFIGYKLRAGESEWNELHLVDVLTRGEGAELRGRTYASIYSPVNAKYRVESQGKFATFRGEFQSWGGGQEGEKAEVLQSGDNYKADIFVPVWTSQLYVSDWWQSSDVPLTYSVTSEGGNWVVQVMNKLNKPLTHAELVIAERVLELGDLPAGATRTFRLPQGKGLSLREFVSRHGSSFQTAAQSRQHAFGSTGSGQIMDVQNGAMAASFVSQLSDQFGYRFIAPPGLDLTAAVEQGNAVLLAWSSDYSPIQAINKFSPRRSHKDTLWRVAMPVNAQGTL